MSRNIPCGACRYMRVGCKSNCPWAPYFDYSNGFEHFSRIHRVYGAKHFSKLFFQVDEKDRHLAVITLAYEALTRLTNPVWGSTAKIIDLEKRCAELEAEVDYLRQIIFQSTSNGSASSNPNEILGNGSYSQPIYQNWGGVNLMPNPNDTLGRESSSHTQYPTWGCENVMTTPNDVLGGSFASNPRGKQRVQHEEIGRISNPNREIGVSSSRDPPEQRWVQYEEENPVTSVNTMLDNLEQCINPVELKIFESIEKEEWFRNLFELENFENLEGSFTQNPLEQQWVQYQGENMVPQQDPNIWVNPIELENFVNLEEEEEFEDPMYLDLSELLTDNEQWDLPEW